MKVASWYFTLTLPFTLLANEAVAIDELSNLLEIYKKESDLSNITKRESAGILDLYTREDLEKMQANNLLDVLKTVPSLYFTRGKKNTIRLAKPSTSNTSLTAVRFYINDHDMSSSSFGSAFMIWGEMPISYIDHIEIYKATSSIEFGNENASLVIKIYTKDATRDNGGKVQALTDNYGSYNLNAYIAKTLDNGLSYFAYIQGNDTKRDIYHNTYNNKEYDLKSNNRDHNLYANLMYDKWKLELGSYYKLADSFVGIGTHATPDGGEIDTKHDYIHLTKETNNGWKLQLSADDIVYDRSFLDENGIQIYDGESESKETVQDYQTKFHDKIISAVVEKKTIYNQNQILIGGFYKYKSFKNDSVYINNLKSPFTLSDSYSNLLHLFSLYTEDTYNYDLNTKFIFSLKGDFYKYDKVVDSQNKYIFRTGVIKNIDKLQAKLFYTDSYIMVAPYKLYNNDTPSKTNPNLDYPTSKILSLALEYKYSSNVFEMIYFRNKTTDNIISDPILGYTNSATEDIFNGYQFKYAFNYDLKNKLTFDIFYGNNNSGVEVSPTNGANLRIYNSFHSFDIYNEFLYKDSYTALSSNEVIEYSLDWTSAIKYHYTRDLSFGLKGENILNNSYKVIYKGLDEPLQTVNRKFWLNMEYTF